MVDVLYVIGGLGVGGTERHLSLVLPELTRRGWRVEVALLAENGPFGEPLHDAGISVSNLPIGPASPIPKLRGLLQLRHQARVLSDRLRAAPPRLLHCFLPTSCIVGGWAADTAGFHPVAMSRRSQASRPALFFGDKALERRALRRAELVFGHSRRVLSELESEGVARERLRMVHNGIGLTARPTPAERAAVRATEGWADDAVILVMVANLIPYKGHADLLRGMAVAVGQGLPPLRLILVGDGTSDQVGAVRSVARGLDLEDRVAFLGRRSDVSRLLAGADVGVLPSHHEGFSNALLEYMAAALPVVATATGGNLDAVDEGRTGILVPVGRPDEIARALFQLVRDRNLRVRMGEAGRSKLEAEFGLEASVTRYEEAYRGILGGNSRPSS